jgi:hypothetical protein
MVLKLRRALQSATIPALANLIEWYDSEDVADGTTDPVTLWTSRVGVATMYQEGVLPTPTKDGELWGSKRTIKLGTDSPILHWPTGFEYLVQKTPAADDFTVVFVGRSTSQNERQTMYSMGTLNNGVQRCLYLIRTLSDDFRSIYIDSGLIERDVHYSAFPDGNKFVFASHMVNMTDNGMSLNGSAWDVGTTAAGEGIVESEGWAFSASYRPDADSMIGYCRAMLVYNKTLTALELQKIMAYYGVPANPS